ncbi:penicillin-binding protein 2 [bacterium AH-315-J04]|nr:penicillin-binding protein 2 [bacterium AH-315-J04]
MSDQRQRTLAIVLLSCVMVVLVALGGRLVYVKATYSDKLLASSHKQRAGRSVIPARRGSILDCRGRVLATSRRMPDVFVDAALVKDRKKVADVLASRLNLSAERIEKKLKDKPKSRFITIARRVDHITADAVKELHLSSVGLLDQEVRDYPLGESMAHVLGFVGREGNGQEGLELAFNDQLAGKNGKRLTVRDARRRALRYGDAAPQPPVDGNHLVLTLDAEIQRITEESLADSIAEFSAESGVAIVMDPTNASVLAMCSIPTFDPRDPGSSPSGDRRNRCVTDPTEPGSTFKPIIASEAIAGKFVSRTERINTHNGIYRIGSRRIIDTKPFADLDLRGIITHSSNIGMSIIATRMGNPTLHETIRRFGFGALTGIECPGENRGLVRPLKKWTSLTTASVSFGYEISVTPIQLITSFAALFNDGWLLKPHVVKAIVGPDGQVVTSYDNPEVVRRVVSAEVANYLTKDLMRSVVTNGGGRRAKIPGYAVAGKTGTAKLLYKDRGQYESGAYMGAFVGAAPIEDPRIVVLVMIRRPDASKGYYGGKISAPAVARIISRTLAYMDVPRDDVIADRTTN